MSSLIAAITHPIQLCAFVLFLVASLLAKSWKSKIDARSGRVLFCLFILLAIASFSGGLYMTWRQLEKTATNAPPSSVVQTSSGANSPNINSSGSGSVAVQSGNAGTNPPSKSSEKK